jgi:hypothetical protein
MIDFPNAPTNGQIFTASNGTQWTWDGVKWTQGSTSSGFLPLAGGTMIGDIVLAHDPPAALNPATKQYVDAQNIRYKNRIINGDMSVDQRNGGVQISQPPNGVYAIDRWACNNPTAIATKGGVGQVTPTGTVLPPSVYALKYTTTTAYTAAAADRLTLRQGVEGYAFLDAQWGTANAQPITLEFWAAAGVSGTYSVVVANWAATRSYAATFVLAAGVWTKFKINIPGDTTGAWVVAGNAPMAALYFGLCVGSTYQTAPNVWTAGNFQSATGAVNVLASTSNYLSLTNVALMVGSGAANAEPEFKKYSDNLIDCQRYFYSGAAFAQTVIAAAGDFGTAVVFPVVMRAAPTMTITSNNVTNLTNARFAAFTAFNVVLLGTASGLSAVVLNVGYTADSDF